MSKNILVSRVSKLNRAPWWIYEHIDIGWSASHTSSTIYDSPWPLFLCVVKFVTLSKYKVISRILIRNSTKLHLFLIQRSWASSRVGDHLLLYFFSRLGITIPPCGQSPPSHLHFKQVFLCHPDIPPFGQLSDPLLVSFLGPRGPLRLPSFARSCFRAKNLNHS